MSTKDPLASIKIWPHQRQAIDCVQKYLKKSTKTIDIGAALIHMPTGTGKSGVIACISHLLPNLGTVLILTPRVALRDQLAKEVDGAFFAKLGFRPKQTKPVWNLKTSDRLKPKSNIGGRILISTIQLLHNLVKDDQICKLLEDNVDLIVVDEGHYEPALSWSETIRKLKAPKVLFTATPFRNDLKLFDVNFDHAFSYSFGNAERDNTIRSVKVHQRTHHATPSGFVSDVIDFYDKTFKSAVSASKPPRVIIRCETMVNIRHIGDCLEKAGKTYVLIHESFKDGDKTHPHERKSVPDPDKEPAVYWVHQFKLLEGIDDPRFQLIALYDELKSTRGLVQQVGRVVRNPNRTAGQIAYFLDHSSGKQEELWKEFLKVDSLIESKGIKNVDIGTKFLSAMQQAQPDVIYLGGRFRSRFDFGTLDPQEELVLSKSVNILKKPGSKTFAELCDEVATDLANDDREVHRYAPDKNTEVFVYLDFRNSYLLRSKCFIECRLGAIILRETANYVCVCDTLGGISASISNSSESVSVKDLRKLFPKIAGTYLTAVSLRNSQLGQRAIRSRSISASHLDDTVPTFDDHSFVCRTAKGNSRFKGTTTRRYIGFGNGRITDSTKGRVKFSEYLEWLDDITAVLDSASAPIGSFGRFAAQSGCPADPTPKHLLLDIGDVEASFVTGADEATGIGEQLNVTDACCEVSVAGTFAIEANDKTYDGQIRFDSKKSRYDISIDQLDNDFRSTDRELKHGMVSYLNRTQSFRVIPNTAGSFYSLGSFYTPVLQFGLNYNKDQIGLAKLLHPFSCLKNIGSEKGKKCAKNGTAWDKDSLFSIVDLLGAGHGMESEFGKPDIVVCDDLGTEAADFILGYSKDRRVVFIHCKGKGTKQSLFSASGLQDVCGQATKNLRYLSRYDDIVPPKAEDWHQAEWKGGTGVTGKIAKRIRKGPANITGRNLWRKIRAIICDPYSEIEVWLFLGRMLSKKEFETQLTKADPAPEAQQAAYLLFSTMNDVAAAGARLKVFCSP